MGKKNKGLPYTNALGRETVGQPADHVKKKTMPPIKLPYAARVDPGYNLGGEHPPFATEGKSSPVDDGIIASGTYIAPPGIGLDSSNAYPPPFPFGRAFETLDGIQIYDDTKEGAKLTKVVKSIIVRRDSGEEIYRVGEVIDVSVGDTRQQARITHIDSMTRMDNNGAGHTFYDVYAKIDDDENFAFHVATIYDMPVEVTYGYQPF